MKRFTFPYYLSFGKGDNTDCKIEIELSDKDANRLVRSAREGGRFRLNEDEEIADICNKVYEAVSQVEQESLSSAGVTFGVNYPEDLQFLDPPKKKEKQSACKSVIVSRDVLEEYEKEHPEEIIYTDEGQTLMFVPKDYCGTLIIDSGTKVVSGVAKRKKIKKIVIPVGVETIESYTFAGCESLEEITVPGSIKAIKESAFGDCSRLKKIALQEGIKEIHHSVFHNCFDLQELYIPASVEKISGYMCPIGLRELHIIGMDTVIESGLNMFDRIRLFVKAGSKAEKCAKEQSVRYGIECRPSAKQ